MNHGGSGAHTDRDAATINAVKSLHSLSRFSRDELKTMVRDASAVFVGQIAIVGFGVTDTIVAGRHSDVSLAALSIGSAVFITVFVSLTGLITALLPIWAEMHGAKRPQAIGPSIRQCVYIGSVASMVGMVVMLHPLPILRWTQVPADLQPLAASYLAVIGWSLPAAMLFRTFATLSQALGRPQLVSWLQVIALIVKVPLSIWFAFGGWGVPELGVVGCAWATFAVNFLLMGLALVLMRTQSLFKPLALWRRIERPHRSTLLEFTRLGVPAALTIGVEITSFTLMALFIARLGTTAAAAHQIAANVTAFLYMVPLSLAVAASARVGFWRGALNESNARHVVLQTFWLGLSLALMMALALWLLKPLVAGVYTNDSQVMALATSLLAIISLFHVADAIQTISIFLLRCYRVTLAPFLIYGVLLWGGGLGGGYTLAYRGWGAVEPLQSPTAFWLASTVALIVTAVLVQGLLRYVSTSKVASTR